MTADLGEQTVQHEAVYRLAVDPSKCNARFLAHLLNSPFGRELRSGAATGMTIPRVSKNRLLELELPIPDLAIQDQLVRLAGDISLLEASFRDMQASVDQNWGELSAVLEKIEPIKGVLNIERQIEDWWGELPYPLATVYRRYRFSLDPRERFETLLHFFEMASVYLAVIGLSHVRAMQKDWPEICKHHINPTGGGALLLLIVEA